MNEDEGKPTVTPTPPKESPPVSSSEATAAEIVLSKDRERELTTKIADLEDRYDTERKQREELEQKITATQALPAPAPSKKKSLLDYLGDFWEGK